jgi:molybdenum cofactor cytidylyltransferase
MMADERTQYWGVVPAAGESRRMGRPKLLLPWRSSTVLQCVLEAWTASDVQHTALVVRATDCELQEIGRRCDVDVVTAAPPPLQMKDSIALALRYLQQRYQPEPSAWWFVAPADQPWLTAAVINRVCRACAASAADIVVPCVAGRRAHPVAMTWRLAEEVGKLGPHAGINALLDCYRVERVTLDDPAMLRDLDTPEDYQRLR